MLSACCSPEIITQTRAHVLTPPAKLLQQCPTPKFKGSTQNDLMRYVGKLKAALKSCNGDKTLITQWLAKSQRIIEK